MSRLDMRHYTGIAVCLLLVTLGIYILVKSILPHRLYLDTEWEIDSLTSSKNHLHGRFIHITDTHPDQYYRPGASISDKCHIYSTSDHIVDGLQMEAQDNDHYWYIESRSGKRFKVPIPPKIKQGHAGPLGAQFTKCDASWSLIHGTIAWLRQEIAVNGVDFILWTGDNARHEDPTHHTRSGTIKSATYRCHAHRLPSHTHRAIYRQQ
jgi:endopolyphosphatase